MCVWGGEVTCDDRADLVFDILVRLDIITQHPSSIFVDFGHSVSCAFSVPLPSLPIQVTDHPCLVRMGSSGVGKIDTREIVGCNVCL